MIHTISIAASKKVDAMRRDRSTSRSVKTICWELVSTQFWVACGSEFLGTMFYVIIGCGIIIPMGGVEEGSRKDVGSLAFGLAAVTSVQMTEYVSGGHINPAVTAAAVISLDVSVIRGLCYIIFQCAGAVTGSSILLGIFPDQLHLAITMPTSTMTPWQALSVEFLMTFAIAFCHVTTQANKALGATFLSIPIGGVVSAIHMFGLPLTGCGINPARSLGPAVISNTWTNNWVYWVGPIAGGIVAGVIHKFILRLTRRKVTVEDALHRVVSTDPIFTQLRQESERSREPAHPIRPVLRRGRPLWDRTYHDEAISTIYQASSEYEIIPHFLSQNNV